MNCGEIALSSCKACSICVYRSSNSSLSESHVVTVHETPRVGQQGAMVCPETNLVKSTHELHGKSELFSRH